MKKLIAVLVIMVVLLSSCATILMGPVSECQRTKPLPGKPQREVRVGLLFLDIFCFGIFTAVDFATGAIFKPCGNVPVPENHYRGHGSESKKK